MQKASSKAYVSIRKLKKYQEERERQLQQQDTHMAVIEEQPIEETLVDFDAKIMMADVEGGEEMKQQ